MHGQENIMTSKFCYDIKYCHEQKHASKFKLVYIQNKLLHVSTNHVDIFRDVKYEG